jgi:hypothetical protein
MAASSDDDKTLVLAVLEGAAGQRGGRPQGAGA